MQLFLSVGRRRCSWSSRTSWQQRTTGKFHPESEDLFDFIPDKREKIKYPMTICAKISSIAFKGCYFLPLRDELW